MIAAAAHLRAAGAPPAVCVAVHAVFAEGAFEELRLSGAARIVITGTILNASNGVELAPRIAAQVARLLSPL
jgi:ribose-phosphate pyrophosphokinase